MDKQAGLAASYALGWMVIGKKLAEAIADRIAISIAASAAYKTTLNGSVFLLEFHRQVSVLQ